MPTNKEFGEQLEKRTKQFAIRIIRLCCQLPKTPEANIVRSQLVRSSTSIGANYREANRSISRADFRHRISICEKECSESQYWLEIIMEAPMLHTECVQPDYTECSELLAIFTSIGRSLK
ncbi:MAG: four helix bundle protein [Chloroflexota bacterium]|nr:four helix bundle protein [Chloroflexota bacterium]